MLAILSPGATKNVPGDMRLPQERSYAGRLDFFTTQCGDKFLKVKSVLQIISPTVASTVADPV